MNALLSSDATVGGTNRPAIFYLAYTSQLGTVSVFGKTVFTDICQTSSEHNRLVAVTGFLFFKKGQFFQYLEGTEAHVRALYQTICQDKRHKNLRVLLEGYQETRLFPDWAMHCFKSGYQDEGEAISPHLQDFMAKQWTGEIAQTVIGAVKTHYQGNPIAMQQQYQPIAGSYWGQQVHSITQQHFTFIVLQLAFMLMALLMAGYWLCFVA